MRPQSLDVSNASQAVFHRIPLPLNFFHDFVTWVAVSSVRERRGYDMTSALRVDVGAQVRALFALDQAPVSLGLYPLLRGPHDRIILTGMGPSHFAALPSWRRLVARGKPTLWIDAAKLLNNYDLITPDSLLIATSRSGVRAEVLALLKTVDETIRPAAIVAITDDLASPLAAAADGEILLRSISLRSPTGFLNALAAHDYLASMILSEDNDDIASTARVIAETTVPITLSAVAAGVAANPGSRLAYVGFGEHAATSFYAASLTTEATGITAQGYVGEESGPVLLSQADTDLTALLFSGREATDSALSQRLAAELLSAGSTVVVVGHADVAGSTYVLAPASHVSAQLAHGVVVAEHFVSSLTAAVEEITA
jgi:fructoselysine-6-P-deglycase FrlB-like protein